ncbi:MAG: hypothetical protein K2P67_10655 [Gallionellaceae bacterium]|jgi:hypothetical protein|nr:hypothetical protein [Gallionellaceae bacterium]
MSTVTFDTLKFAEKLKQAGVPEGQAKAMAEAQNEVFSEALDTQLATKRDLIELKLDMIKWIVGMGLAEIGLLLGILIKR